MKSNGNLSQLIYERRGGGPIMLHLNSFSAAAPWTTRLLRNLPLPLTREPYLCFQLTNGSKLSNGKFHPKRYLCAFSIFSVKVACSHHLVVERWVEDFVLDQMVIPFSAGRAVVLAVRRLERQRRRVDEQALVGSLPLSAAGLTQTEAGSGWLLERD